MADKPAHKRSNQRSTFRTRRYMRGLPKNHRYMHRGFGRNGFGKAKSSRRTADQDQPARNSSKADGIEEDNILLMCYIIELLFGIMIFSHLLILGIRYLLGDL